MVYPMKSWKRVIPWSFDLVLFSDQTFLDFDETSDEGIRYNNGDSNFRSVMDDLADILDGGEGEITTAMVFHYQHSIASRLNMLISERPDITMGELAFMVSRSGYMVQDIDKLPVHHNSISSLIEDIRAWAEPNSALAWLSAFNIIYHTGTTKHFDSSVMLAHDRFEGISFDKVAPYVNSGLSTVDEILSAVENDVDPALVASL